MMKMKHLSIFSKISALLLAACLLLTACGAAKAPVEPEGPEYYGEWEITAELGRAPISALSDEEAQQLIGQRVSYSADTVSWTEGSLEAPQYTEQQLSRDEFAEDFRIDPALLGLEAEQLWLYAVEGADFCGDYFAPTGAGQLVLIREGVFFAAQRVEK